MAKNSGRERGLGIGVEVVYGEVLEGKSVTADRANSN